MPKKAGARGPAVEVKSVSLSAVDWAFLAALGEELKARGDGRATNSNAIRFLIGEESKRKGRVEVHLNADGTVESQEAKFEIGVGEGGGILVRRLNLETGEVYHMTKTQEGPFTWENRTRARGDRKPAKKKPATLRKRKP